ncbi:MAG TPA: hypothetical protein VH351_14185 [Bryobacteraceae bacterium]|jgi:hypothetical protein|nr:hypothetical protein [Bryobacteraceae bacterium]
MSQETSQSPTTRTSAADNIRELTEASKQLIDAGKQMSDSLSELSNRVEHARDVGKSIATSPWLFVGMAVAVGTGLIVFGGRSSGV